MTNALNSKNHDESNGIDTQAVIGVICLIVLIVIGFYLSQFHSGLSIANGDWGTFGDYVGGILNPIIAAFAFYLIAETYKLQKKELEAARKLLEVSTNAQKDQIKLAALTALLNSNLMRLDTLKSESLALISKLPIPKTMTHAEFASYMDKRMFEGAINPVLDHTNGRLDQIETEIEKLQNENEFLEEKIKGFWA